jgi:nucleoside-diphosphate-sugar epimerase
MPRALILGGSGQLGVAVAEELLAANWQVTATVRGGRSLPRDLLRRGVVCLDGSSGSTPEIIRAAAAVFDALFAPTLYTADDARDLLRAKGRFNTLVAVSSASVYADESNRTLDEAPENGFPIFGGAVDEETPTVEGGEATYSTRKVAMENVFLSDGLPVSILRPCAIYGIHARHPREWWFVKRILDDRSLVPIAFNADSVFHTSSARGIASLVRVCMEQPGTRILNVADPTALSVRQIAGAIGAALGAEIRLASFAGPPNGPLRVGGTPWSTELPFVLDVARARKLGWNGGTEYAVAVREVCDWLVATGQTGDWRERFTGFAAYGYDPFDYRAEDAWITAQGTGQG